VADVSDLTLKASVGADAAHANATRQYAVPVPRAHTERYTIEVMPSRHARNTRWQVVPALRTFRGQSLTVFLRRCYSRVGAEVAQLVEQPIRNRQVPGSSPGLGSRFSNSLLFDQFTFPFSGSAENLGTFGNTKPATLSTARFCDSGIACV
jgi:hypothetical protein